MQDCWEMISGEHYQKLIALAEESCVDLNTALKNILKCLHGENDSCFSDPITARQIEEMIDTLTV